MAAQLKDGGRYPASQKLTKAELTRFVEACTNPQPPSDTLKAIAERFGSRKAACR